MRSISTNQNNLILLLLLVCGIAYAQTPLPTDGKPEPAPVIRIFSDSNGESHFSDEIIELTLKDYAPPAPPVAVSTPSKAGSVALLSAPSGWFGDWHPAPRRQFLFCLSGELEMEVSDGEIRRIQSGSILLVEDTSGKGHTTRVVSAEPAMLAAVPLAELSPPNVMD